MNLVVNVQAFKLSSSAELSTPSLIWNFFGLITAQSLQCPIQSRASLPCWEQRRLARLYVAMRAGAAAEPRSITEGDNDGTVQGASGQCSLSHGSVLGAPTWSRALQILIGPFQVEILYDGTGRCCRWGTRRTRTRGQHRLSQPALPPPSMVRSRRAHAPPRPAPHRRKGERSPAGRWPARAGRSWVRRSEPCGPAAAGAAEGRRDGGWPRGGEEGTWAPGPAGQPVPPSASGEMVRPTGDALRRSAQRDGWDEPSHLGRGWALCCGVSPAPGPPRPGLSCRSRVGGTGAGRGEGSAAGGSAGQGRSAGRQSHLAGARCLGEVVASTEVYGNTFFLHR